MRRNQVLSLGGAALLSFTLAACGGAADGEAGDAVALSYNMILAEDHPSSQAFEAWMSQVNEATDGAVEFETFYNGSLCASTEASACIADGRADIGHSSPTFAPSDFPIAAISSVGFITDNVQAHGDALNDLYAESDELQAEYVEDNNQRLLYFGPSEVAALALSSPIESLDDVDSLSLRTSGAITTALQDLGANPVTIDQAEQYESVERGVVDGVSSTMSGFVDNRIYEVAPHLYDLGPHVGAYVINSYAINQDVWDGLSEDVQQAMSDASEDVAARFAQDFLVPSYDATCSALAEGDAKVSAIDPPADEEAWRTDMLSEMKQQWTDGVSGTVEDSDALFDTYLGLIESAEDSAEAVASTAQHCMGDES